MSAATWSAPDTTEEAEMTGASLHDRRYSMRLRYEKAERGQNFHEHDGWHVLSSGCYVGGRKPKDRGWTYEEALRVYSRHLAEKQYRDWLPIAEAMTMGFERGLERARVLAQRTVKQHWWKPGGGSGEGYWKPNEPALGPCPKCGTIGPDKTKCQTCG